MTNPGCIAGGRGPLPEPPRMSPRSAGGTGAGPARAVLQTPPPASTCHSGPAQSGSTLCSQTIPVSAPVLLLIVLQGPWGSYSSAIADNVLASGLDEWVRGEGPEQWPLLAVVSSPRWLQQKRPHPPGSPQHSPCAPPRALSRDSLLRSMTCASCLPCDLELP